MTRTYLLSFDTDTEISVDDRHALKETLGEFTRLTLGVDVPVAIDSLDAGEPQVAALLPPVVV